MANNITWQNINATPNYEGTSLLKLSTDLANQSFKQLGSVADDTKGMIDAHIDDKLQNEIFNLQQGQKNAAETFRSSISALESLPGVSNVDSLTGKVEFAKDEDILSTYKGDPADTLGMKAYVEAHKLKAIEAAKQFSSTDYGIMTDEEYNTAITKTAQGIGKRPEEIKLLQDAYKFDINKDNGMTQADQMDLAAEAAQMNLQEALYDKQFQAKQAEEKNGIDKYKGDMAQYQDVPVDQFAQNYFGPKNWDEADIRNAHRISKQSADKIAMEFSKDPLMWERNIVVGSKDAPQLSDDYINAAIADMPLGEGGWGGLLLDLAGQNQQVEGDLTEQMEHSLRKIVRTHVSVQDKEAALTRNEQQNMIYKAETQAQREQRLYNLNRQLQDKNRVLDPKLLKQFRGL